MRKKGNFSTFNEKDETIRVHIYDGSQNPIVMSTTEQMELFCNFDDLYHYPFDDEICSLDMTLKGTDKTFASLDLRLIDKGPANASYYLVRKWEVVEVTSGRTLKFKAKVFLSRRTSMTVVAIYLPTLLLTIISQATNYLNSEEQSYFGIVVKLNISTMLVLAIIYRSVSTSLPVTMRIKMVEVWLLSSLVYPFAVILINLLIHNTGLKKVRVDKFISKVGPIGTGLHTLTSIEQPTNGEKTTESDASSDDRTSRCMALYLEANSKCYYLKIVSHYLMPLIYVGFIVAYFLYANFISKQYK